jgi:ADP-ribose pyrophosphatase YjhB (NUDIX family)
MTERFPTHQDVAPCNGASIAVYQQRSVLLVKRAHPPFAGLWSLPGGKTDQGETPRETALRELKEETGIEATIEGVLDTVDVAAEDGGGGYRLTVFYGRYRSGSVAAGGDAEAVQWADLDDIEGLPMTEGTAALVWLGAHRLRTPLIG